jgi:tRNA 5-methylaminomethyl-2-thiouridine biosynthesis bifunctional protein
MKALAQVVAHWRGRARFVVFDAAYKDGAAFGAMVDAWRADPARPARLHVVACAAPGTHGLPPGFHRMLQADPEVTLDLLCAVPAAALGQLTARIDACMLHGLEQAGVDWARPLARLCAPHAVLIGEHLNDAQLAALAAAGFAFLERQAPLVHAVHASRKRQAPQLPTPQRRAIVVGAGLAGSAVCERLCARGWQVALIERHAQAAGEASGNPAGIFMPVLSKDDNPTARLSRAAFLFALRAWERLGGIGRAIEGAQCGVLQLARDAAHAQGQRQIAARQALAPSFARWLEGDAAAELAGIAVRDGACLFEQGGWAHPASVCAAMLAACGARLEQHYDAGAATLRHLDGQWQAIAQDGAVLAQASTVILANGNGAGALAQASGLPLASVRGQVTYLDADSAPRLPLVVCGEAYITPPANGIVSVGATYDEDGDSQLRAASQLENLERLRALLADETIGRKAPLRGRVAFRSVAPDRLPLVGALPDLQARGEARIERLREVPRHGGLYGLLGYASRGLIWAPLAAELLAAQLEGEPLPLESSLADALDPARFALAAWRRAASLA